MFAWEEWDADEAMEAAEAAEAEQVAVEVEIADRIWRSGGSPASRGWCRGSKRSSTARRRQAIVAFDQPHT